LPRGASIGAVPRGAVIGAVPCRPVALPLRAPIGPRRPAPELGTELASAAHPRGRFQNHGIECSIFSFRVVATRRGERDAICSCPRRCHACYTWILFPTCFVGFWFSSLPRRTRGSSPPLLPLLPLLPRLLFPPPSSRLPPPAAAPLAALNGHAIDLGNRRGFKIPVSGYYTPRGSPNWAAGGCGLITAVGALLCRAPCAYSTAPAVAGATPSAWPCGTAPPLSPRPPVCGWRGHGLGPSDHVECTRRAELQGKCL